MEASGLPAGYTRDKSFLTMVVDIVKELKQHNAQLVYGRRGAGVGPSLVRPRPPPVGAGCAEGRVVSSPWTSPLGGVREKRVVRGRWLVPA